MADMFDRWEQEIDEEGLQKDVEEAAKNGGNFKEVPHDTYEVSFEKFKDSIKNCNGEKVVYFFSLTNAIDEVLFSDIKDIVLKPVPSKMYEIYKEIIEDIKRGE